MAGLNKFGVPAKTHAFMLIDVIIVEFVNIHNWLLYNQVRWETQSFKGF